MKVEWMDRWMDVLWLINPNQNDEEGNKNGRFNTNRERERGKERERKEVYKCCVFGRGE